MSHVFRLLNSYQAKEAYGRKLDYPNCFPASILLETTNRCNFQCPLCPTGSNLLTRPKGFLPLELAQKAFDETARFVEEVSLGFFGEPLLHPELINIIKAAKDKDMRVKLFTNLSMQPPGGWKQLLTAGPDHIIVSADSLRQQNYAEYRKNGNLAEVKNNLADLLAFRDKNKTMIEMQMLAMKQNEGEWPEYVEWCRRMGVDLVKLKYLHLGHADVAKVAETYLPDNSHLRYYNSNGWLPDIKDDLACHELYLGPAVIAWDGSFILCCQDFDGKFELGNIRDMSIWEFWNSFSMARIRSSILSKKERDKMCNSCPSLLMGDLVLERITINQHEESSDLFQEEAGDTEGIAKTEGIAEEIEKPLEERMVDFSRHEKRAREVRRYNCGDIVDYGSYRTFTVREKP